MPVTDAAEDRTGLPAEPAAGPTVAVVAADRNLGLRVVAGGEGMSRGVLAAHTSELRDPTPWLHGGELLMTTGLQLDQDDAGLAAYVERLATAGVACLAVGIGPRLTLDRVPAALSEAALRVGLPVLEVPEGTPFLAVTETVFAHLAAARYAEQVRALEAQRTLTASAVHPGGTQAVVSAFADLTGMDVLVTDLAGRPIASSPDGPALRADLLPELPRLRAHGLHATASLQSPGRDVRVQPLGSQQLRGFLVCAASTAPTGFDRQLAAAAVSLLTLELEDLSRAGDAERRRRSEVARTLLAGTRDEPAARDLLASVGLRAATVRVVAVVASQPCAGPGPVEATLGRLLEALPDALTADDGDRALLLVPDPPEGLADLVQEAVGATADAAAGIGATVAPSAAARSARSACRAAEVARATGPRVVDVLALASSRLLLTLQPHGAVAAFADAVLGPVEQAGGRGGALLSSLRAFLECNGSWEEAAARLGVHRHTLRQRLRRVEELSGRRLDSGHDRMELLLAFEARDLAGHT